MILIVDDIRANILALKKILELHGLETDSAESGEDALRKILKKDYSLIIMDVQMPVMDGFEVVEILAGSNRTKDIPVIFLSAVNKEKRFISKGYETGGVDYVTKPVDPDLLILKVKSFLKLYEQKQELKNMRDLLSKEIEIRKEAQENLELKVNERTQELLAKNEELEFSNHELQQFAWVVSHDLKEPLRKIETFIKIIDERYLPDNDTAKDYVRRTIKSAERMSNLISDLIDYSRLSSDVIPTKMDLNSILEEVLADLDYRREATKATVNVSELPAVMGVSSQLRQLFQNLISNSLKFTREGIPPIIQINAETVPEKSFDCEPSASGRFTRITVTDNGIGFNEIYLDKIFKIFQSLNDRNAYEGTGIGLAIANKIVEKHNGIITAKSSPGKGASFIIVLPLQ
jgi:light-regulated signal transduction histidine kinase (bacteriophytochrome)